MSTAVLPSVYSALTSGCQSCSSSVLHYDKILASQPESSYRGQRPAWGQHDGALFRIVDVRPALPTWCLYAGDGFSRRAEDSILHGCIPVIIMDDVDEKFSTVVDYSKFSVRIAEKDIAKVRTLY